MKPVTSNVAVASTKRSSSYKATAILADASADDNISSLGISGDICCSEECPNENFHNLVNVIENNFNSRNVDSDVRDEITHQHVALGISNDLPKSSCTSEVNCMNVDSIGSDAQNMFELDPMKSSPEEDQVGSLECAARSSATGLDGERGREAGVGTGVLGVGLVLNGNCCLCIQQDHDNCKPRQRDKQCNCTRLSKSTSLAVLSKANPTLHTTIPRRRNPRASTPMLQHQSSRARNPRPLKDEWWNSVLDTEITRGYVIKGQWPPLQDPMSCCKRAICLPSSHRLVPHRGMPVTAARQRIDDRTKTTSQRSQKNGSYDTAAGWLW